MTSIQDEGRNGFAYYAIPKSGYIQPSKAQLANFLVGNPKENAVIECILIPPHLSFLDDMNIAITGDNFNFTIAGKKVKHNKTIYVQKGDVLKGSPQKNAHVAYISLQGKITAQEHYGSSSTYVNAKLGGMAGQTLLKNDVIHIVNKQINLINRKVKEDHNLSTTNKVKFYKGPEYHFLSDKTKEDLYTSVFTLSASSNRMGARLEGKRLNTTKGQLKYSVPVLPGFIQLPPSGQPIVVLNDGQTTGGYPRIGYIGTADIEKFIGIGKLIKFLSSQ